MIESFLVFFLVATNVFQFLFWSNQNQKLIDKLMSKNFAEYQAVKRKPDVKPQKDPEEELAAIEEERQILNELNGMLPQG